MKIKIHLNKIDDAIMLRSLDIGFPTSRVKTPVRTVQKYFVNKGHINEIFHLISRAKLGRLLSSTKEETLFNKMIQNELINGAVNFTFLSYQDIGLPSKREMELLADLQYVYSDAAIVPLCPNIINQNRANRLVDSFHGFINGFIEEIDRLNNKSIIGLIPARYPRQYLTRLFDLYDSYGVVSFVIDSDGSSIFDNLSWLRKVQTELHQRKISDDGFIYNINSNPGKFIRNAPSVLAKDFITLPFGIDILGSSHISPKLPSDVWIKLSATRDKSPRLFNPLTYGYYKDIKKASDYEIARRINIQRQQREAEQLQEKIREEATNIEYLKEKREIKRDKVIDTIIGFKKDVVSDRGKQISLFDE